jgi:hypothetical protein
MSFVFDIAAAQQASAMGKFNQRVAERNAAILEYQKEQIAKQTEFDIARFDKSYQQLVGSANVSAAKSGVERSGTFFNVDRYNAEQSEIQKDVMEYNSQVAQAQKIEEANFARISGQIKRQEARIAQLGYYSRAGESLLRIGEAKGMF